MNKIAEQKLPPRDLRWDEKEYDAGQDSGYYWFTWKITVSNCADDFKKRKLLKRTKGQGSHRGEPMRDKKVGENQHVAKQND